MRNSFAIEAEEVSKTFYKKEKRVDALQKFSIKIHKGSIYGLLGPNGAGKSTFINILAGIVIKNSGKIKILDIDQDLNPILTRKKIGVVQQ